MKISASHECPSYFRNCVLESRHAREGYARAGYHLGIHLDRHVERHVLDLLQVALDSTDPLAGTWSWFAAALPRCRALIPTRRRGTFVRGLLTGARRTWPLRGVRDDLLIETRR
jgi:hypothetical protein